MTSVTSVSRTGNPYVDGLFTGGKWTNPSLTYSFPTSSSLYSGYPSNEPQSGFLAFTSVQQQAVAKVLQNYSAVSNLQFSKITESATSSAVIRYGETNATSTAWAYYPSSSAQGGDAWFNSSKHYYDNPVPGNYAYSIMLHETGHTLGLKHPQDTIGTFGVLPSDHDAVQYTVMSYRSYVGGPLSYSLNASSYPQTLMMDDIRALQTLYGANYTTNSGNTVYSWSPTTGIETINGVAQSSPVANKIFMTLWDGGGVDTYDFSNYTTGVKADLNPGGWTTTSSAQVAALGSGHYAPGNIANAYLYQGNTASLIENAIGGSGNDVLAGNQANNQFTGRAGNDFLSGNAGTDTAVYSGAASNYSWKQNSDATWTVTDLRSGSPDGTDRLAGIEKLQFTDGTVTLNGAVTSTDTYPVISSAAASVSLTEWADGSTSETNNVVHKTSGTLTYWDPDTSDAHVASFVAEGSGYAGTFKLGTLDDGADSLPWSFSVADSAIDFLAGGQTVTQKYDVTINDGHGGKVVQTVAINLVGKSDVTTTTTTTATAGAAQSPFGHNQMALALNDQAPAPAHDHPINFDTHPYEDVVVPPVHTGVYDWGFL